MHGTVCLSVWWLDLSPLYFHVSLMHACLLLCLYVQDAPTSRIRYRIHKAYLRLSIALCRGGHYNNQRRVAKIFRSRVLLWCCCSNRTARNCCGSRWVAAHGALLVVIANSVSVCL